MIELQHIGSELKQLLKIKNRNLSRQTTLDGGDQKSFGLENWDYWPQTPRKRLRNTKQVDDREVDSAARVV